MQTIARISLVFLTAFLLATPTAFADSKAIAKIKAVMAKEMPDKTITKIVESPLPGIYEVHMPPRMLYINSAATYVVSGDLIRVSDGENLTLPLRDKLISDAVNSLGEDSMIIFNPKKQTKHTVTVFTDLNCGYCRKLHSEIDTYLDLGIRIRYVSYPRAGIGSESYKEAVSVWCSDDRHEALTRAKNDQEITSRDCENPVKKHYRMGEQLGIQGTPTIVLESGQIIPGYVPADRLFAGLEQQKKVAQLSQ